MCFSRSENLINQSKYKGWLGVSFHWWKPWTEPSSKGPYLPKAEMSSNCTQMHLGNRATSIQSRIQPLGLLSRAMNLRMLSITVHRSGLCVYFPLMWCPLWNCIPVFSSFIYLWVKFDRKQRWVRERDRVSLENDHSLDLNLGPCPLGTWHICSMGAVAICTIPACLYFYTAWK